MKSMKWLLCNLRNLWKHKPVMFLQNSWWEILTYAQNMINPFYLKTCICTYSFTRKKSHEQQLNSEVQQETHFDSASQLTTKTAHFILDLWSVWSQNTSVCLRVSFQYLWLFAQFQSKQHFYFQVVSFCPFDVILAC